MAEASTAKKKHVPGCETTGEEIFDFPFLTDEKTIEFIRNHGRIMFIIRGPPGTAKGTLSALICDVYSEAVTCSADAYFNKAFVAKKRDKTSLKNSHLFCQSRVREECQKKTNIIVVQNTHIKKWEVDVYLNFAKEYEYTVIMAVTLRKFDVSSEILEETNRKHLSKDYLQQRIKQWEEYIPFYLGWFLCPGDECFILRQAKDVLQHLLEDKTFCNLLKIKQEEDFLSCFTVEEGLFCIAAHRSQSVQRLKRPFYLSDKVQDAYGKCFQFAIHGFMVNDKTVYAVAAMAEDMKCFVLKKQMASTVEVSLDSLFDTLNLNGETEESKTFKNDFSVTSPSTAQLEQVLGDTLNVKHLSYILLARSNVLLKQWISVEGLTEEFFADVTDENGFIQITEFCELSDHNKYFRLKNNSWFILLKEKIAVSSIFTGKYK